MISHFAIKNFRCFRQWDQTGLKRFNFIVGESGVGKTALLEALFLAGGNSPEIWFRIRRWRGLGEGPMQMGLRENYEAVFRDLFYQYDQRAKAAVTIWDISEGKREVEIFYEHLDVYTLPLSDAGDKNAFSVNPIIFKWDTKNKVSRATVEIRDGGLRMSTAGEVYPIILISPRAPSSREYAQFYSNLHRTRKAAAVLEALKSIFNEVKAISLEMVAGEPILHVDVDGLNELIPIGDLSGGIEKFIDIIVSIVTNRGGVILIDEIESGFYYKNTPGLLKSIVTLCDKYDVQLFASTHSYEFLQMLSSCMLSAQRGAKDFCLIRLEKEKGHQPTVTIIPGESYTAAMQENFEVR
ncbi:MAG: ATP/GTP-binding protein [Terriglobales bacterium]